MNEISTALNIGTIGELLTQLKLLQYQIQAAPPLKDSGNDLIAIRGNVFKAIQVKTTTRDRFALKRKDLHKSFHVLCLVQLIVVDDGIQFDRSRLFLLLKSDIDKQNYNVNELLDKEISRIRINTIFEDPESVLH